MSCPTLKGGTTFCVDKNLIASGRKDGNFGRFSKVAFATLCIGALLSLAQ